MKEGATISQQRGALPGAPDVEVHVVLPGLAEGAVYLDRGARTTGRRVTGSGPGNAGL